jgi:protein-disulfide isomerase
MQSNKSVTGDAPATDVPPRANLMTDLVKGAVIILCLAGAYKLLFEPQVPGGVQTPQGSTITQPAIPVAPVTTPQAIPDQVKALGSLDEKQLGEMVKQRAEAVKTQGLVKFTLNKPAAPNVPVGPATTVAPTTPLTSPSVQPTPSTLPVPRPALQTPADGPIAKIGYHPDGTVMSADEKKAQIRDTLKKIPDNFTIAWKAPAEKASIYVFTDPTCPYCQKLHHAIAQLNAAGISVHYMLYPRDMGRASGNQLTTTQENLNNVWCSLDQKAALNDAYSGYKVPPANCDALPTELNRINSPVAQHYFLGNVFNVRGTPTVFTADGKDLPGFQTAEKLISDVLN